jgi:predicted protein tyrosine phosphatase
MEKTHKNKVAKKFRDYLKEKNLLFWISLIALMSGMKS